MKRLIFAISATISLSSCAPVPKSSPGMNHEEPPISWMEIISHYANNDGLNIHRQEYMISIDDGSGQKPLGRWATTIRSKYPNELHGIENQTRMNKNQMIMDWFPSRL